MINEKRVLSHSFFCYTQIKNTQITQKNSWSEYTNLYSWYTPNKKYSKYSQFHKLYNIFYLSVYMRVIYI